MLDLYFYIFAYLCVIQYVHYEVDYSDVEMNKEEKGKEKKKEEKVNKMRQDNHLFIFTYSD